MCNISLKQKILGFTKFNYSFIYVFEKLGSTKKSLTPPNPPPHTAAYASFFTFMNKNIFKQEKPEMDDFERKKHFDSKGKILKFKMDTLEKTSQNMFASTFVSEHSKHFFILIPPFSVPVR